VKRKKRKEAVGLGGGSDEELPEMDDVTRECRVGSVERYSPPGG
jgi:hypothetical protein